MGIGLTPLPSRWRPTTTQKRTTTAMINTRASSRTLRTISAETIPAHFPDAKPVGFNSFPDGSWCGQRFYGPVQDT